MYRVFADSCPKFLLEVYSSRNLSIWFDNGFCADFGQHQRLDSINNPEKTDFRYL